VARTTELAYQAFENGPSLGLSLAKIRASLK